MDDARYIFAAGREFHRDYGFGDHFGNVGTDHVYAQDAVRVRVCQHFDEAARLSSARARPLAMKGNCPALY